MIKQFFIMSSLIFIALTNFSCTKNTKEVSKTVGVNQEITDTINTVNDNKSIIKSRD